MPGKFTEQTLPHNDWQLCGFQERLWYLIYYGVFSEKNSQYERHYEEKS